MAPSQSEHEGSERTEHRTSIWTLLIRFKWRVLLTASLVILEAVADLLFPLFIGIAINGLLEGTYRGVIALGGLTGVALILGSARRLYDTRAYAGIYEVIGSEMVERERRKGTPVSAVVARSSLLEEFVQFLEASVPGILTTVISLVGVLVIVTTLKLEVGIACVALLIGVLLQYSMTERMNHRFNAGFNDELERRVEALTAPEMHATRAHFKNLMRWSIKISDLETFNFAVIFVGVIALLVYSPIAMVDNEQTEYGFVFAALIYVFQYVEGLVTLPYFFQQIIRLREISGRLSA